MAGRPKARAAKSVTKPATRRSRLHRELEAVRRYVEGEGLCATTSGPRRAQNDPGHPTELGRTTREASRQGGDPKGARSREPSIPSSKIREALTTLLIEVGYEVTHCKTLECVRTELGTGPCVLLLDLFDRNTGSTALPWILDLIEHGDAPPTMILSGRCGAKEMGDRFGIPFMGKPFDIDELLSALGSLWRSQLRPRDGFGQGAS